MKKEDVYVVIDSEEKRLRALQILEDAGEKVYKNLIHGYYLKYDYKNLDWFSTDKEFVNLLTEITLDQLEQLLNPNYTVKEVHLTIEELKAQAESLGFELVKKERKPKVGDFGLFWDNGKSINYKGFLTKISVGFYDDESVRWDNFRFLTDEEKANIQNNW